MYTILYGIYTIYASKTTAAQNEVALSYRRVHGLHFLAVVFVTTIYYMEYILYCIMYNILCYCFLLFTFNITHYRLRLRRIEHLYTYIYTLH